MCVTCGLLGARRRQPDVIIASKGARCYEILEGAWQTDSALAKIQPQGPIWFALTNVPDTNVISGSAFDYTTRFGARVTYHSPGLFTTWRRLSDTGPVVEVGRFLPMSGYALHATLRGTDLVGAISAFTDAIPPDGVADASHAATARRVPCSSTQR